MPLQISLNLFSAGETAQHLVFQGQEVQVTADGNPTTGYSWSIKRNTCAEGLQAVGLPTYESHFGGLLGQSGVFTFTFETPAAGSNGKQCEVEFRYEQPWAPLYGFSKTIEFTLS